jgi:hypothetical protein
VDKELLNRHREESQLVMQFVKEDIIKNRGKEAYEQGLNGLKTVSAFDVAIDEFKKRFLVLLFFVLLASFMMRRSPNWSMSR